jgi:TctA family transporter
MMIVLEVILGVLIGFIIGLIPNIHINTISYICLYFSLFSKFQTNFYFFLSIAISQTITSFVPLSLFGIPSSENILCLFPTQKLFLEGKSKISLYLCLLGSFLGSLISILFLPVLFLLFTVLGSYNLFIYLFLILILIYFIFSEKSHLSKMVVFSIIIFCGVLGIFTLKYNYFSIEPLFVCVFGLFGMPHLLLSLFNKSNKVFQNKKNNFEIEFKDSLQNSILGVMASLFIILIPSFSSSQASLLVTKLKKLNPFQYIISYSAITISSLIFSFYLVINFSKSRLGYISLLLANNIVPLNVNYIIFISIVLFSSLFSIFLIIINLDRIIDFVNYVNHKIINLFILFLSLILIFLLFNFQGLLFLLISTFIGFLPIIFNKNKLILMSYIIIPTLLYYIL